jgi:hypothetical protein
MKTVDIYKRKEELIKELQSVMEQLNVYTQAKFRLEGAIGILNEIIENEDVSKKELKSGTKKTE